MELLRGLVQERGKPKNSLEVKHFISRLTSVVRPRRSKGPAFPASQDEHQAGISVSLDMGAVSPSSERANV